MALSTCFFDYLMEEKPVTKTTKTAYALALEVGSTATAWIVIPALLAVYGGRWLDQKFQTKPIIFVVAMAVAFVITLVGIIRMAQSYLRQQDLNGQDSKDASHDKTSSWKKS
jgi:MFS-type transporter involved in bile tolerance (Atg22 family)